MGPKMGLDVSLWFNVHELILGILVEKQGDEQVESSGELGSIKRCYYHPNPKGFFMEWTREEDIWHDIAEHTKLKKHN